MLFFFTLMGASLLIAQESWQTEMEVGIFVCHIQTSADLVQDALKDLTQLQEQMQKKLNLAPPREKVELYIFQDEASWKQFHDQHLSNAPFRRAFFTKSDALIPSQKTRGRIYAFFSPDLAADLRHEGTHAIFQATFRKPLPIWLDEGIAEYFEADPKRPAEEIQRAQAHTMIPLKTLEKITGMQGMTNEAYGDSWAWAVYLFDGPENVRGILPAYIKDYSRRRPFNPSISSRVSKIVGTPDEVITEFWGKKAVNPDAFPINSENQGSTD